MGGAETIVSCPVDCGGRLLPASVRLPIELHLAVQLQQSNATIEQVAEDIARTLADRLGISRDLIVVVSTAGAHPALWEIRLTVPGPALDATLQMLQPGQPLGDRYGTISAREPLPIVPFTTGRQQFIEIIYNTKRNAINQTKLIDALLYLTVSCDKSVCPDPSQVLLLLIETNANGHQTRLLLQIFDGPRLLAKGAAKALFYTMEHDHDHTLEHVCDPRDCPILKLHAFAGAAALRPSGALLLMLLVASSLWWTW